MNWSPKEGDGESFGKNELGIRQDIPDCLVDGWMDGHPPVQFVIILLGEEIGGEEEHTPMIIKSRKGFFASERRKD